MTKKDFLVRSITEDDYLQWFNLRKMLWDESEDDEHREEMTDIIEHYETQLVLVAENTEGKLIGFLEASIRPFVEDCHTDNVGYLEGWFVVPEFRRRGVGGALVATAEQWAKNKGCSEMASDSEVGNDLSLNAHLNLGYQETSRLIHLRKEL